MDHRDVRLKIFCGFVAFSSIRMTPHGFPLIRSDIPG
jgi:hypothetical protein